MFVRFAAHYVKVVPGRGYCNPQGPSEASAVGTPQIHSKIWICQFVQGKNWNNPQTDIWKKILVESQSFIFFLEVEHAVADDQLKTTDSKEKEW